MNTENLRRIFFSAFGAVCTALAPTLPYIILCTVAVLADCLSAWMLSRRVKKAYPAEADRETGKFKSYHFGKTIWTLLCVYMLLIFAYFLDMYVTSTLPFNALKVAAGAVIFWQAWSILENASSCNGAKWAKILQQIMVDKTERHLDIDLSALGLNQHGADTGNGGNRSAKSPGNTPDSFDAMPTAFLTTIPENALRLRLERTALREKYTIGHLYVMKDGKKVYVCDTIEDAVRDVNKNGKFDNGEKKIKTLTAIPYGTYFVGWAKSPKFSNYAKYPYTKKYNGVMPWVRDVPSFQGILIHCGTSEKSSAGCLIVGYNKVVGRVVDSQAAFYKLMDEWLVPAKKKGQKIYITIV